MSQRGKWGLLGALVLVWLIVIVLRVVNEPEPQRVPLKFKSGETAQAGESTRGDGGIPGLVRPKLARGTSAPFKTPKNIFSPVDRSREAREAQAPRPRPKPTPAPLTALTPPPPPPVAFTAPPSPSPEQLAAQQARQWLGQYRFFGYLGQGGDERAFLSKGHDIFIVRVGDTIEGRIMVADIDASSVRLRETSTSLETTLQLTKDGGSAF